MQHRFFHFLITTLCACLLSGCHHFGPSALPDDHMEYNKAITSGLNRQILLNIVRSHFHENSLYVAIENVTSRNTYQLNGSLSYFNPFNTGGADKVLHTLTAGLGGTLKEEPAFVYSPQTNDKYAIEMLQPLRLKALYYVIESEADFTNVIRLMFKNMGPYLNFEAEPLLKPYSKNLHSVRYFIRLANILGKIYAQNGYLLYYEDKTDKHPEYLELPLSKSVHLSAKQWEILRHVNVKRGDKIIYIASTPKRSMKDVIPIQVRSLVSADEFLSFGVSGPPQDNAMIRVVGRQGLAVYKQYQHLLTKRLMCIHSSKTLPKHPLFAAVQSHGYWFYINDDDVASKITFRLFRIFQDLTQADMKQSNILLST